MQTITAQPIQPSNIKSSCARSHSFYSWLRPFSFRQQPKEHANATSMQSWLMSALAPAFHSVALGLDASGKSLNINLRIAVGAVLITAIAPAAYMLFLLFPTQPINKDWFFSNWHYYLLTIGPHLYLLITVIGVFLLFPAHSKRAYFLMIPSGITIANLINISAATRNEDINRIIEWHIYILSFLTAFVIFLTFDWLTHRKFHQHDKFYQQLKGLINLNIDKDTKLNHIKTVVEEGAMFHQKY